MKLNLWSHCRIAFQGESGAFSEEAARQLFGENVRLAPCRTFEELFAAIEEKRAEFLLAPVENSLAGAVARVHELLRASGLRVVGEVTIPIVQHLIGCRDAEFESVRAVISHPMALAQCGRFFAANPRLEKIIADDTAGSVRAVCERGDKSLTAIGSERAAKIYGGKLLRANLHDAADNFTRFVLLAAEPQKERTGELKIPFHAHVEIERDARSRIL